MLPLMKPYFCPTLDTSSSMLVASTNPYANKLARSIGDYSFLYFYSYSSFLGFSRYFINFTKVGKFILQSLVITLTKAS